MKIRFLISLFVLLGLSDVYAQTETNSVVLPDNALELYRYRKPDGGERVFFEFGGANNNEYGSYKLYTQDVGNKPRQLVLFYDRYNDGENMYEDGWFTPLYYRISPNRQNLYVVTQIHANSNGWTREYQMFKIDCKTLKVSLIADCAGVKTAKNGFTIAVARLKNKKETFTYKQKWLIHDVLIDWEGKTIKKFTNEYHPNQLSDRYADSSEDYTYIKGFKTNKDIRESSYE